ncbi:TonB family protein [Acidithiobacillus sp. IBUN Pt1247-S3]
MGLLVFWLRVGLIRMVLRLGRLFLPRAADLDQLFPWLLAATAVVGSLLLLFIAVLLPERYQTQKTLRAHDSRIEITLAPLPRLNQFHPATDIPSLAHGAGLASSEQSPETLPTAAKQKELAAYLLLWQKHILTLAKSPLTTQKLPIGKIVVAVTISASGQLLRIQIVQGEQNRALAQAVREILIAAAPFPPLPSAWQSPPQNLRIIRTWNFH